MLNLGCQSLAEQHITELEIEQRRKLFAITQRVEDTLKRCRAMVRSKVDLIIDIFYAEQLKNSDMSCLMRDPDTWSRLRVAQVNYVLSLFSGEYGMDYVNDRLRIGLAHERIGIPPKLYLAALVMLKQIIVEHLREHFEQDGDYLLVRNALSSIIKFDISYVLDRYIKCLIDGASMEKKEVDVYVNSLERLQRSTHQ